jgi:hypothetical protein
MTRPKTPLLVKVDSLAWLAGHWIGKVSDDDVEEIWTQPSNGSLLGMFRWFRDGEIRVIEIITIANFDGATCMKFKHLDDRLSSWEAQDETTYFALVECRQDFAAFLEAGKEQWLIYERSGDKLKVHFERYDGPPSVRTPFEYNALRPSAS